MSTSEKKLILVKKRKKTKILAIALSAFCVLSVGIGIFAHNNVIFRGEIIYLDFEGGFFGIVSDNNKHYDPINLSEEFQEVGLRVSVVAWECRDLGSYHMWGEIIEIRHIRILSSS